MRLLSVDLRRLIKQLLHIAACTLYIALICTTADFCDTPIASAKDVCFMVVHWSASAFALFAVLLLFSYLPNAFYTPLYALIAFISSILAHYRRAIGFSLNTSILDIIFKNDIRVSATVISWNLIAFILIVTFGAVLLALQRKRYSPYNKSAFAVVALSLVSLCICFNPRSKMERAVKARIPFNIPVVVYDYWCEREEIATERPAFCFNADCHDDKPIVIAVIGESLRPDNMGINGYERNTTPMLTERGVVSFKHVYSPYTYTNKSVPFLLTRATRAQPEIAYKERSFIDVFNQVGYKTATIINQKAEQPFTYFMHESDTLIECFEGKDVYVFRKWLDEDILPHFQSLLHCEYNMILVHCIGSHWWYGSHYSDEFEQFTPVMQSRIVSECDSMEIVNSYDNTVLYTDYVISAMIDMLADKNAVLLYISDHGEMLGEQGKWLHAMDEEVSMHTAAFIWMSDKYKSLHPDFEEWVAASSDKELCTDFYFYSVLSAAGIDVTSLQ